MGRAFRPGTRGHRRRAGTLDGVEHQSAAHDPGAAGRLHLHKWTVQLGPAQPSLSTIGRKASFFFGLFLIFFALQSPLDPISDHLLSFHQAQHFILRMVAPMFILLGAPLTPMLRGMPAWARQGIIRPMARNHYVRQVYRLLTNPIFTVFFFLGSLYLWQFPGAFNLALRNDEVHALMHLTMSASGFLFWWVVIDPPPHRSRLHYGLRVLYLGLIVLPNTLLGAAITFSSQPGEHLYVAYKEVTQPYGLEWHIDQQLGGLMLWVPGDMMSIVAAGIVMIMWYQREEAQGAALASGPARGK